ncbi:uncharacterized protein LOC142340492 [Convolutriloba macropyga]|uniref:uncharacterized protein LOC142340492 n=1 Tax=Convolutriloba macropyga TaxID=536237 RepID=UPI003F52410C
MLSPTINNSNSFFPAINEPTSRNFGAVNRNTLTNRKISNPLPSSSSSSNTNGNLNLTLLSRPYFFQFIKYGTKLETKIRRIKARNWNTTEVTEEMTNFFSSICEEFQKSNDVITLFLDGLDQMFKLLAAIVDSFSTLDVADSIISEVKTFKDRLMGESGDESTSILQQTRRALQSIKLASEMCQTTTSDLIRAAELTSLSQYTDSDVVDLQKECKISEQILAREISSLERLCVDAHERTQEAKEFIDDHKWKDHETVRQEIIMSKIKVRDSKNSTDRALKARTDATDMQETLKRAVSALINARPSERSDKFEEVQEQLEKVRGAEQKLRDQYKETNECLEAVGKAARSLKQLNPSDQWPMLRCQSRASRLYFNIAKARSLNDKEDRRLQLRQNSLDEQKERLKVQRERDMRVVHIEMVFLRFSSGHLARRSNHHQQYMLAMK